jgi:hypothetical protein
VAILFDVTRKSKRRRREQENYLKERGEIKRMQ